MPYKTTLRDIRSKRPERNTVISPDEVLNLVILLNTTDDVQEFLKNL